MSQLDLREPFSAISHALGLALAIPGAAWLWRRAGGDRARRAVGLVFGVGLIACYAASGLYHAVRGDEARIAEFRRLDHVGIDLLIAGTYTPIAWVLLAGRWRGATLALIWLAAAADAWAHLTRGPLHPAAATAIYLAMGWGSLICYAKLSRDYTQRRLWPIPAGGLAYSVGAAFHVADSPTPLPGVVGPHDVFHLFVIAGSALHFGFILAILGHPGWAARPGLPAHPQIRAARPRNPGRDRRRRRDAAIRA